MFERTGSGPGCGLHAREAASSLPHVWSGHHPLPSQAHLQEAEAEAENPGLQLELIGDASIARAGLTHCAATPNPQNHPLNNPKFGLLAYHFFFNMPKGQVFLSFWTERLCVTVNICMSIKKQYPIFHILQKHS